MNVTENVVFLPHDLAKLAKKKGFRGKCIAKYTSVKSKKFPIFNFNIKEFGYDLLENKQVFGGAIDYNSDEYAKEGTVSAPSYEQMIDWLETEHNIHIWIECEIDAIDSQKWLYKPCVNYMMSKDDTPYIDMDKLQYSSRKEALKATIKLCLEKLVK